jgi:hypothetical protein
MTGPPRGLLASGRGLIRLPKRFRFYCGNIESIWLGMTMGKRTRVQVEPPHIIQELPVDLTTEDEELGTDHRHGMAVTTNRPGTIDHDAGPLS